MLEQLQGAIDSAKSKFSADPQLLSAKLALSNDLVQDELDMIEAQTKTSMKTNVLFQILKAKPDAIFLELQKVAFDHKWLDWLEMLQEKLKDCERPDLLWIIPDTRVATDKAKRDRLVQVVQENLESKYKVECQFIKQFWTGYLESVSMEKSYVKLELERLTVSAKSSGVQIEKYDDLFINKIDGGFYKRILVEGDPGSGKTTYANKIAFDWTNREPYLRSTFDFLFIFPLQSLIVNIEKSINSFVPDYLVPFMRDQLKNSLSKILFIFDGFDEMDTKHQTYTDILSILNREKFAHFTCILTTRRSHVDQLPSPCREQWLLLTGFDDKAVATYMKNQGCQDLTSVVRSEESENVNKLLRVPLFCAIYCSLHIGGALKEKQVSDVYSLVDIMIDNYVRFIKDFKKLSQQNVDDQLQLIGEYALLQLDDQTKNFVNELFYDFLNLYDDSSLTPLSSITLGLLARKNIPTGRYKDFKLTFVFPHQLIAECLAAQFFLKTANFQYVNVSVLYRAYGFRNSFDLPFVQFLLTRILNKCKNEIAELDDKEIKPIFLDSNLCLYLHAKSGETLFRTIVSVGFGDIEIVNKFTGSIQIGRTVSFFKTLQMCSNLKQLSLDYCDITSDALECFTNGLNANLFQQMEWLNLDTNLCVGRMPTFCEALKNCPKLKYLNLSHCTLRQPSVHALAKAIEENLYQELEELYLTGNPDIGLARLFFKALAKCNKLKSLDLESCQLAPVVIDDLTLLFEQKCLQLLQYLNLSCSSYFSRKETFFKSLQNVLPVKYLSLNSCEISLECAKILFDYCNSGKLGKLKFDTTTDAQTVKYLETNFQKLSSYEVVINKGAVMCSFVGV